MKRYYVTHCMDAVVALATQWLDQACCTSQPAGVPAKTGNWTARKSEPDKKGEKLRKKQVVSNVRSYSVEQVGKASDITWQRLRIRTHESRILEDCFAVRLVRFWDADQPDIEPRQEWLVKRIENNGTHTYAFSNAPE